MDSLVANYTSSEEEDEDVAAMEMHKITPQPSTTLKPSSSLFSSVARPQNLSQLQVQLQSQALSSSSHFSSLPKPKQQKDVSMDEDDDYLKERSTSSMLFSSLPEPQTQTSPQPVSKIPKNVILLNPLVPSKPTIDDDEEEEEKQPKRVMGLESVPQSSSVKSFLSSIPAPKHSAMALGSGSASGSRKSILQTETTPSATPSDSEGFHAQNDGDLIIGNHHSSSYDPPPDSASFNDPTAGACYAHYSAGDYPAPECGSNHNATSNGYSDFSYNSYHSSAGFVNYGEYGNAFTDGSVAAIVPATYTAVTENAIPWRMPAEKRRRNGMMPPAEIVEVSQDDLTKNRPREDQAKLTGIAFGPAYQPAASSKGKPSKLHKRKHQIGSLYYDLKQKEMELAERRAKGFLTKAQTQGKYGW